MIGGIRHCTRCWDTPCHCLDDLRELFGREKSFNLEIVRDCISELIEENKVKEKEAVRLSNEKWEAERPEREAREKLEAERRENYRRSVEEDIADIDRQIEEFFARKNE